MAAAKNPVRGSRHRNSKLTEDDVRLIRQLLDERAEHLRKAKELSARRIAEKFEVNVRTIDKIGYRESWIHV